MCVGVTMGMSSEWVCDIACVGVTMGMRSEWVCDLCVWVCMCMGRVNCKCEVKHAVLCILLSYIKYFQCHKLQRQNGIRNIHARMHGYVCACAPVCVCVCACASVCVCYLLSTPPTTGASGLVGNRLQLSVRQTEGQLSSLCTASVYPVCMCVCVVARDDICNSVNDNTQEVNNSPQQAHTHTHTHTHTRTRTRTHAHTRYTTSIGVHLTMHLVDPN